MRKIDNKDGLFMDVVELFLKLLSYESVTPDDAGSLAYIEEYLEGFEAIYCNKEGVKNLFLTKQFGPGEHLCFAGHVDVVPAGEGWNSAPFVPMVKDGRVYARGTQDMKSGVAAFVQACKEAKNFTGRLSVLLTSDEEGEAIYGTRMMLEHLKERSLLPDYVVVAEPTCEEKFGDAVKIGRRGSINGLIVVKGKQGHAAYPQKAINPVHQIAPLLDKIAGYRLDEGDEDFAPSQMVVTDIRGGMEVTNVTPGSLRIMFNVRNSTATTKEMIKHYIEETLERLDYELSLSQGSYPFVTNRESKIVTQIDSAIKNRLDISPKYSTAGGTSDARFMGEFGIDVVEFGVINDTIHAPNESTTIKEIEGLYGVFAELIDRW